jgi:hypothetical protein
MTMQKGKTHTRTCVHVNWIVNRLVIRFTWQNTFDCDSMFECTCKSLLATSRHRDALAHISFVCILLFKIVICRWFIKTPVIEALNTMMMMIGRIRFDQLILSLEMSSLVASKNVHSCVSNHIRNESFLSFVSYLKHVSIDMIAYRSSTKEQLSTDRRINDVAGVKFSLV